MASRSVTLEAYLAILHGDMRSSVDAARQAAQDWRDRTTEIEARYPGDPGSARAAKRDDHGRIDALAAYNWHSTNVRTMAAAIQAEIALRDFRIREYERGLRAE